MFLGLQGGQAENQARRELAALNAVRRLELVPFIAREEGGTRCVAVKCIDITQNTDCEGSLPARK